MPDDEYGVTFDAGVSVRRPPKRNESSGERFLQRRTACVVKANHNLQVTQRCRFQTTEQQSDPVGPSKKLLAIQDEASQRRLDWGA